MTLLEPSLRKLRAITTEPIEILTRGGHAPLIELMEGVRFSKRSWLRSFDAIFCYDDLDKSAAHALLAFAPRKDLLLRSSTEITYWNQRAFFEIRTPGIGDRYLARYNWDYTIVDSPEPWRPPQLTMPRDTWKPEGWSIKDYVLLNSTAGWKSKRWKSSSWIEVAQAVLDAGGPRIVVTSGDQDWQREHAGKIATALGDRALYLGGKTKLEEFLWLVSRARCVVGVDGAASHLAAAFGVRNLTLFFRTNPLNWHYPSKTSVALTAQPGDSSDELDPAYEVDSNTVARAAIALL